MRSRYVAYLCRDADYLLATWSPSTRPRTLSLKGDRTEWQGLHIVETQAGGAEDRQGVVEFIARFASQGQTGSLHERSRFARVDGAWLYIDGETRPARSDPAQPALRASTPGRNDPCPCGSGQKYKRCCGR
jgi:SEC-C motif-containing protein